MTTRRINNDLWVTITHNNKSPEMLAHVRRGPLARPTAAERIEHLLTRVPKKSSVAFGEHALEHTLSFQRRVHAIKADFLWRGRPTPLGITQDYWDRTEDVRRLSINIIISTDVLLNQSNRYVSYCAPWAGSAARCSSQSHPRVVSQTTSSRQLDSAALRREGCHWQWTQAKEE